MNELTQIPKDQLVEGVWYMGRGRNANVALWCRLGLGGDRSRLTFLTIGFTFHTPVIKDEGYYDAEDGCFQPFMAIKEGTVIESMGVERGWGTHYAKRLSLDSPATYTEVGDESGNRITLNPPVTVSPGEYLNFAYDTRKQQNKLVAVNLVKTSGEIVRIWPPE